ncbi:sensor histidine kinase [Gordonia humi]|uniref:histidine kinase n=1 Tax=Gordonia humi TaxID=686429 RepID=A0A840EZZ6_9ACTN|nr:HAMP domain-containing sensor histidine kinase [Gordonia humi]MBB4137202.1 signal transduction histidine kinase [Gordonia humi]
MLALPDIGLIALTTAICTAVVMLVAAGVLRLNRRGRVAAQFAVVVCAAVASIVSSVLAVMVEMFLSTHDLTVLVWVVAIATLVSLVATWAMVSRAVSVSVGRLAESARHIAAGAVIEPADPGWREFNDLHARLVDASEQLALARGEVEKLDQARRQFFAWISHDLRTPLAGIRAMSEAIDDGVAPEPGAYIRTIRTRVDTLTDLVDDLFALSTLQSGTLRLERELVPLLDLVSDAVVDVRDAAASRGIRIEHRDIEGHMLWADPRELSRAVGNLLANAVRHAPAGSDVLVTASHRGDDHLIVSVLDQGPGVASEDLGRMFDVGWRAGSARTVDSDSPTGPGAGLGLAIVRGIAEAHGGGVGARHVADGFEMSIVLPVGEPAAGMR